MKSVFPVVEETVLLDTLCSSDNNVNQATETLLTMGFNKQHNITTIIPKLPRVTLRNNEYDYDEDDVFWLRTRKSCDLYDKTISTCSSWPVSSDINLVPVKTDINEQIKSKNYSIEILFRNITILIIINKYFLVKQRLQEKFNDQEEKIIIFALESTDYNEILASQILKTHINNEYKAKNESDK